MRCLSCNCVLTDYEATRKSAHTNMYIDLCNSCFSDVQYDMDTIERPDLEHEDADVEDDDDPLDFS